MCRFLIVAVGWVLLPSVAQAAEPCHHGVVCDAARRGPEIRLEARAGYVFRGNTGATTEATLGFGNIGLGLPENILFIGELGFTRGGERRLDQGPEVQIDTYDLSAGVRAYWPTRGPITVFGDVLLGAANHAVDPQLATPDTSIWTFMGQLGLGLELNLFSRLYLVGRVKLSLFNEAAFMLAGSLASSGSGSGTMVYAPDRGEVDMVRLTATGGLSWAF